MVFFFRHINGILLTFCFKKPLGMALIKLIGWETITFPWVSIFFLWHPLDVFLESWQSQIKDLPPPNSKRSGPKKNADHSTVSAVFHTAELCSKCLNGLEPSWGRIYLAIRADFCVVDESTMWSAAKFSSPVLDHDPQSTVFLLVVVTVFTVGKWDWNAEVRPTTRASTVVWVQLPQLWFWYVALS